MLNKFNDENILKVILFCLVIYLIFKLEFKLNFKNIVEKWRDLPFIGYHNIKTHKIKSNPENQIYPISLSIDEKEKESKYDSLFSALMNSITKIKQYVNQNKKPIVFNYAERPIILKKINNQRIKVLVDMIIDLLNQFSVNFTVKYIGTSDEKHEETDNEIQSRISFNSKIMILYNGLEKTVDIYSEFIFEKISDLLPEEQFFKDKQNKTDFILYMSKMDVLNVEVYDYLAGMKSKNKFR